MTIRRGFIDLNHGQVHYRWAGIDGPPLLLLHAGPGSARQLEPLIADLAPAHRVIAPDLPGNGDSTALPIDAPAMADYAAALVDFLDAADLDEVAIYGTHTGAALAVEAALLAPGRVTRVVIDGLGLFTAHERRTLVERYAHPFPPDLDGAYLMRAFHFLRDQYLFFPWYDRSPAALRGGGLGGPDHLHAWLVEVLKAAETYHHAYRAAFTWPGRERLPLVARPALMMAAADDPLHDATRDAAPSLPGARFVSLPTYGDDGFAAARRTTILTFLGE